MHELSVAGAILATAVRHADERQVTVVAVRVGALRQVVPRSLVFYWGIVATDTPCAGSRLEVTAVAARLHCDACGCDWEPVIPAFRCPECLAGTVTVTAGEELEVDYIEVAEPAHA